MPAREPRGAAMRREGAPRAPVMGQSGRRPGVGANVFTGASVALRHVLRNRRIGRASLYVLDIPIVTIG